MSIASSMEAAGQGWALSRKPLDRYSTPEYLKARIQELVRERNDASDEAEARYRQGIRLGLQVRELGGEPVA